MTSSAKGTCAEQHSLLATQDGDVSCAASATIFTSLLFPSLFAQLRNINTILYRTDDLNTAPFLWSQRPRHFIKHISLFIMPCNYTASRPVINSYLQTIELAYLRDLAPNQLNDLCDQCVWQPAPAAKGSTAERKDKTNLLAWIARNMPELKHPSLKMETQALLERSITLRRLESGEAGEDAVQIKQEDGELLNEHPDTKPLRCSSSSKKQRVQDQQLVSPHTCLWTQEVSDVSRRQISSGGEDRVVHDLHGTASSSQLVSCILSVVRVHVSVISSN